ncbi:glucose-6-phosphate isomerase [Candidatus Clavichlamydia salmonicola]|uniref:glucose-6-phosphate isomerase n=1 Tax=Candidatus Clavichlamydia salmonicola TaxID=469812 RepID=UPI001891EF9E|nr:glucose-6-phosphate isomerase [Candidatus Clavichlamydia salmonicola]
MSNKKFTEFESFKKLQHLALAPYDLTQNTALNGERLRNYCSYSQCFTLVYGMERINDDVLIELENLAKEADLFNKMQAMQRGEIINFIKGVESEERAVLHTALRAFVALPISSQEKVAQDAARAAAREFNKLNLFLDKNGHKFSSLIQVGIGGSELGPKAMVTALQKYAIKDKKAYFVSNVDPDEIGILLPLLDLSKTLVVIVSKSGSTLETQTNEKLLKNIFEKEGYCIRDHFIAVTEENSLMDNKEEYAEVFYIWDYIGGRYSVSSMVGGVVLSFLYGMDVFRSFLEGAHYMDQVALRDSFKDNLPMMAALLGIWNRNFLDYPGLAILPYSRALSELPAHIQQCDMESNGKQIDKEGNMVNFKTGPSVWGEPGVNGQHSFYQSLYQGTDIIPVEFIGFRENQTSFDGVVDGTTSQQKLIANLLAQSIALAQGRSSTNANKLFKGNRPSRLLIGKSLTPFSLGALISFYEHKIAFQGFCWNINSFDQEGVQLGKVLAHQILGILSGHAEPASFPEATVLSEVITGKTLSV